MAKIDVTWNQKTIEIGKSNSNRPYADLYPDTVVWGIAVNGVCNPSLATLLKELVKTDERTSPQLFRVGEEIVVKGVIREITQLSDFRLRIILEDNRVIYVEGHMEFAEGKS